MSRVLVDLQACQTEGSQDRGIGRYSRSLALTLAARHPNRYELWFALSGAYPDSARELRKRLVAVVPNERLLEYRHPSVPEAWTVNSNDLSRTAAGLMVENRWMSAAPDLIHISSVFEGLGGRAVVPQLDVLGRRAVVSATAYDLIPLLFEKVYLADPAVRDWYFECLNKLRACNLILAISEATRRDVIEHLRLPADRVVNIGGAADPLFCPAQVVESRRAELARKYSITRPFVMYTGGNDHRKNVEGLIAAYAALPMELRAAHQLAIVYRADEAHQQTVRAQARLYGLAADELVLTGFVSDDDLVDLYRTCKLFIFPSMYEGFGLPILEAMASGAPCIAADNSSLPEVIGDSSLCFDAGSRDAMATAMIRMLSDEDLRRRAAEYGLVQARNFSWERTAQRAADAFEHAVERASARRSLPFGHKPRLAFVSPLPPERSGIGHFNAELLPFLQDHFDIDLYVTDAVDRHEWMRRGYAVFPWQRLPSHYDNYEGHVFYHIGNSEFHAHAVALMVRYPGVALIHDAYLSGLTRFIELAHLAPTGFFAEQIKHCHGERGLDLLHEIGDANAVWRLPLNRWIAELCDGIICTSAHARELLSPSARPLSLPVAVIPLWCEVENFTTEARRGARSSLGIDDDTFVFCSFGYGAVTKATLETIAAWAEVAPEFPNARFIFVGEPMGLYGDRIRDSIVELNVSATVSITGYVDDATFDTYLLACDAAVQLRRDSRGEMSGAVLQNLARGTPVIVNDHGAFSEIAPDGALHLPDHFTVGDLAGVMRQLASDPKQRAELGAAGRAWLGAHCAPEPIAAATARFIHHAAAFRREARVRHVAGATASSLLAVDESRRAAFLTHLARFETSTTDDVTSATTTRPLFGSFVAGVLAKTACGDA